MLQQTALPIAWRPLQGLRSVLVSPVSFCTPLTAVSHVARAYAWDTMCSAPVRQCGLPSGILSHRSGTTMQTTSSCLLHPVAGPSSRNDVADAAQPDTFKRQDARGGRTTTAVKQRSTDQHGTAACRGRRTALMSLSASVLSLNSFNKVRPHPPPPRARVIIDVNASSSNLAIWCRCVTRPCSQCTQM